MTEADIANADPRCEFKGSDVGENAHIAEDPTNPGVVIDGHEREEPKK